MLIGEGRYRKAYENCVGCGSDLYTNVNYGTTERPEETSTVHRPRALNKGRRGNPLLEGVGLF